MTAAKRIMIDGYNLGLEKGTGVATYARNLSHEARNLGYAVDVLYGNRTSASRNGLMREVSFFDTGIPPTKRLLELAREISRAIPRPFGHDIVEIPMTGRVVTRTYESRLPSCDRIYNAADLFRRAHTQFNLWSSFSTISPPERPDLAHWTYPLPLKVKGRPNIYTLHDLVPLRLPYTTLDNKRRYLKLLTRLARNADHIVTVSECSKRDLIDIVGIAPDRITNTYQSVEIPAKFREKSEDQVAREVEGAAGVGYKDYYLFWGSIEPKKNIGRMIEAYLASQVDAPLVIVGAQAWKAEDELQLLNDEAIRFFQIVDREVWARKRVIMLSYAPFGLLVSLIRGARAALFPSLYEGFGLPALEAMSLGTPVICSNTSSLPEVTADAALMIDPYDTAALSGAIRAMDADAGLRDDYARRGVVQAGRFSPAAYREQLETVYARFL